MGEHTPAPWVVEEDDGAHVIYMGPKPEKGPRPAQCILVYDHGLYPENGKQYEEACANARLIAAAPELLELCRQALDWFTNGKYTCVGDTATAEQRLRRALREALRRAEGRGEDEQMA